MKYEMGELAGRRAERRLTPARGREADLSDGLDGADE
mgnify:CR=1 FL=1